MFETKMSRCLQMRHKFGRYLHERFNSPANLLVVALQADSWLLTSFMVARAMASRKSSPILE